jgi:hypothetical protein
MTNPVTMIGLHCGNCHWQVVEHLKAAHPTCKECFAKDTKEKRYPNWKAVEKVK